MKISVFGTGYVGLVTGVCFAEMGNTVVCADVDPEKIAKLRDGKCPIYEPGIEDLLQSNIKAGRLHFTTDLKETVAASDLIFIAVGTPSDKDGSADLKYVLSVAETIGQHMNNYKVIVNKSTVPVGTFEKVKATVKSALQKRQANLEFDIVSNPEFLREGNAMVDCLRPSRVIVGCDSERAQKVMKRLYDPFLKKGNPLLFMNPASAEMAKYAANAMLATRISFMNEISRLCDKVGADVEQIRLGIGSDPRIGNQFIFAGIGFGGSCFPKDLRALIKTASDNDEDFFLAKAVEKTNQIQRERYMEKVRKYFGHNLKGKKVAVWGVSFKPNTNDIREAAALDVISWCLQDGATVAAFDPIAEEHALEYFAGQKGVEFCKDQYDVLHQADVLLVITEWKSFREPDFDRVKSLMRNFAIFDGRNIYDPSYMKEVGVHYEGLGRA